MLYVERGVDVDAGVEQLFDILPPLGMAAAGDVGVGKLVDHQQLVVGRQGAIEIELGDRPAITRQRLARENGKAVDQRLGFLAAVRLDDADSDPHALSLSLPRRLKHRKGLAHPSAGPEENLELSAFGVLCVSSYGLQKSVRIRSLIVHRLLPHASAARRSSKRTA